MGKIDWYILKKFLVTFFFCMVLFMVVAIAVDSSEKTDDFVKTGLKVYAFFPGFIIISPLTGYPAKPFNGH